MSTDRIDPSIQKKISALQLHVRRLLNGFFLGTYRSTHKGYGLEFDQLRDYQLGDDIRFIDWKSTARTGKMVVKEYIHEHAQTIIIVVDISASVFFSSTQQLKRDLNMQLATVLAFAAEYVQAHVGLILFADVVECYIPPRRGAAHRNVILERLWCVQQKRATTQLKAALDFLAVQSKKNALVFILSDCIDDGFQRALGVVARLHEVVVLRCLDRYETEFPSVGFLHLEDSETGQQFLCNTKNFHAGAGNFLADRLKRQNGYFKKYGIDYCDVRTDEPFVDMLIGFFKKRLMQK